MAQVQIFEEEKWPITVRRAWGTGAILTKNVTIKVTRPDGEKPTDVTLDENAQATHQQESIKVADDQPNYVMKAKAEYKNNYIWNTSEELEETCKVWPKKVKVIAEDITTGDKIKDFKFKLRQGDTLLPESVTGDDGSVEVNLKKEAGPYVVTASASGIYAVESQAVTSGKLREITVKVKRLFKVKYVSLTNYKGTFPPTDTNPLKAYVNLDVADLPVAQTEVWGNEIEIEVAAYDDDGYEGKAGDEIFIQAEFGRESKRNDPLPELKDAGTVDKSANTAGTADAKQVGKVTLADNGSGKFTGKFKLELGFAGGDTCSVKIANAKTGFGGSGGPEVKFINWRRLTYELLIPSVMAPDLPGDDLPDGIRTAAKTYLEPMFIEYVKEAATPVAVASPAKKGVFTSAYLKRSATGRDCYIIHDDWETEIAATSFTKMAVKTCMKIRMCDSNLGGANIGPESPKLTVADFSHTIDDYALKTKGATADPAIVATGAGTGWEVVIADKTIYHKKTALNWDTAAAADPSGAVANQMTVTETVRAGARNVVVAFADASAVPTNGPAVTAFINDLLDVSDDGKITAIRADGNKISIKITGQATTPLDQQRFDAIKSLVTSAHTASAKKVYEHPGLKNNGEVLEADNEATWFTQPDWLTVKIQLPKRAAPTDPLKVGDIVGPETATTAPVKVYFKVYTCDAYNGGALRDQQTMVLRLNDLDGTAQTLCHELGHSMGMTLGEGMDAPVRDRAKPPGTDVPKHVDGTPAGPYYSNGTEGKKGHRVNGHIGLHCASGAITLWGQPSATWKSSGTSGACLMWGAGAATRVAFCIVCKAYIRARNLSDISTDFSSSRAAKDL